MATAVAATTVYLVWPAPQHIGGTTSGSLHMYLNQPGKIVPYRNPTVADSPVIDFDFTVSPANVRPGSTVRATARFVGLTPAEPDKRKTAPARYDRYTARYTGDINYDVQAGGFSAKGDYKNVFLYPDAGTRRLPTTKPVPVAVTLKPSEVKHSYDSTRCVAVDTSTDTLTFTVPKNLSHGAYLVSPIGRPRITEIMIGPKYKTAVDPESAGAQAEGALPKMKVFS